MGPRINWNEVVKKEAKGKNDEDLGEVQEVKDNYILVQRGIIKKEIFYIPKDQAESYDGSILKFKFSEQELGNYQDEISCQETDSNTTKMKQEITVQDADFKNKTKAVKNRKKISSRSRIPLEDKKKIIS